MKFLNPISLVILFLVTSCGGFLPNITSGNSTTAYEEDLSHLRPDIVQVDINEIDSLSENQNNFDSINYIMPVNDSVNMVLDSIAAQRLMANKVSGYTILVFSSMSREEARKAIGRLYKALPDAGADLRFEQPFFRVKVGKFLHEYHSYKMLNAIREEFPGAIVIPETYKIIEPEDEN